MRNFSGVVGHAEIHMTPLKFQIVVLGPQLFKKGISCKLFHREISPYHSLTLTKQELGKSRLHFSGTIDPAEADFDNFRSD
jgi:hypothetical protein